MTADSAPLRDEYTTVKRRCGDRGARLDEILDVLNTIWTENPAQHHGTHFVLPRSHFDLRPVSPGGPPVLLGGWAPSAMQFATTSPNEALETAAHLATEIGIS